MARFETGAFVTEVSDSFAFYGHLSILLSIMNDRGLLKKIIYWEDQFVHFVLSSMFVDVHHLCLVFFF